MTVDELKEDLKDIPGNAVICFSKAMVMKPAKELEESEIFELILDQPIHGTAYSELDNEFRFCFVDSDKNASACGLAAFSKKGMLRRLDEPDEERH